VTLERQLTSFTIKFVLVAVLLALFAVAAFAGDYVMGNGTGMSQNVTEAVGKAVSQATSDMYSHCNGRITNVTVTQHVNASGGWFYADAQATGYCETR